MPQEIDYGKLAEQARKQGTSTSAAPKASATGETDYSALAAQARKQPVGEDMTHTGASPDSLDKPVEPPNEGTYTSAFKSGLRGLTEGLADPYIDLARQSKRTWFEKPYGQPKPVPQGEMDFDKSPRLWEDLVKPGLTNPYNAYQEIKSGWENTNSDQMMHGIGKFTNSVIPLIEGVRTGISGIKKAAAPTPGARYEFEKPYVTSKTPGVETLAKSLGGEASAEEMQRLMRSGETALPDMLQTEREWLKRNVGGTGFERVTNKTNIHEDALQVAQETKQRIFDKDIKPFVSDNEEVVDLRGAKQKAKQDLQSVAMTDGQRQSMWRNIDQRIPDFLKMKEAETLREQLRAEADALQGMNSIDRARAEKTIPGANLAAQYNNVSDAMYDHISNMTADAFKAGSGYNIQDAMRRYGAVKDIHNALLAKGIDQGMISRMTGTYMAGGRNVIGQTTRAVGGHLKAPDTMIRQAFDQARAHFAGASPQGNAPTTEIMGQTVPKKTVKPTQQDLVPEGQGVLERPQVTGQGSVLNRPQYSGTPEEQAYMHERGRQLMDDYREQDGLTHQPRLGQLGLLIEKGPKPLFPNPGPIQQTSGADFVRASRYNPQTSGETLSLSDPKYMPSSRQLPTGLTQLPAGTENPNSALQVDPRLPSKYAQTQPYQQAGPGYMGPINQGTEGPLPTRGEQTATPMNRSQRMRFKKSLNEKK